MRVVFFTVVFSLSAALSTVAQSSEQPPRPQILEVAPKKKSPPKSEQKAEKKPVQEPPVERPAPQHSPDPQHSPQTARPIEPDHLSPNKRPVPEKLKEYIHLVPVLTETDRKDACLYLFDDHCFVSLNALQTYLVNQIRTCRKDESIAVKKIEVKVLEDEEFKTKSAFEFEGKTYTEQGLYLHLIETYFKACKKVAPSKSQTQALDDEPLLPEFAPEEPGHDSPEHMPEVKKPEQPTTQKEPQEYDNFAGHDHKEIGTLHSKAPVFLRNQTYARAGKYGPHGAMEYQQNNRHPSENYISQTDTLMKVCMPVDEVLKLFGASHRAGISEDFKIGKFERVVDALPTDRDGEIDTKSIEIVDNNGKKELCYGMSHGIRYVRKEDFEAVKDFYNKAFDKYDGLSQLPEGLLAELRLAWVTGKTTEEKVAGVEHFWRTKVKYLLDDHALYQDYFKKNPDANIVRASCAIGQGRCVPKNFGLAVAIHELSNGEVPVRMDSGYSMERSESESRPISTSTGHLGIQVLVRDPKSGVSSWRTVEASIGSETMEEVERRSAESKQILDLIRSKLADKKRIRVPMRFTQYREDTHERTSASVFGQDESGEDRVPGGSLLKRVTTEKVEKPKSLDRALIFEEKPNGDLELSQEKNLGDFFTGQLLPKTSLAEMVGGERYLASFMGYAEYSNDKGFGRTWKHLGGERYQDTRALRVYLPDGSHVEETQVFTFNFASPDVLESVSGYVNGELSYEAVVIK